jgi:hypothetical protein
MTRLNKFGYIIYAIALAGFGIIQFATKNFLTGLFPVPGTFYFRNGWMYLASGIFLISAAGIIFRIKRPFAATLAGITFFLFFMFLHLPILASDIYNGSKWTAAFETLAIGSGAFMLAYRFSTGFPVYANWYKIVRIAGIVSRYLFALSLLVFGTLHIVYNSFIQTLIPSWMPAHAFLSYVIPAGFLLAGISFITGWKMVRAAALLGLMFLLWVLLLHLPRSIHNFIEPEWSSLFVALAMSGISFSIPYLHAKGTTPQPV